MHTAARPLFALDRPTREKENTPDGGAWQRESVGRPAAPKTSAWVAAARKLTVTLFHMLTAGEPYRQSPQRATHEKLCRLRYHATGRKERSGPLKGSAPSPFYGTGQRGRTVKARLDRQHLLAQQKAYEDFVAQRLKDAHRERKPTENS